MRIDSQHISRSDSKAISNTGQVLIIFVKIRNWFEVRLVIYEKNIEKIWFSIPIPSLKSLLGLAGSLFMLYGAVFECASERVHQLYMVFSRITFLYGNLKLKKGMVLLTVFIGDCKNNLESNLKEWQILVFIDNV